MTLTVKEERLQAYLFELLQEAVSDQCPSSHKVCKVKTCWYKAGKSLLKKHGIDTQDMD